MSLLSVSRLAIVCSLNIVAVFSFKGKTLVWQHWALIDWRVCYMWWDTQCLARWQRHGATIFKKYQLWNALLLINRHKGSISYRLYANVTYNGKCEHRIQVIPCLTAKGHWHRWQVGSLHVANTRNWVDWLKTHGYLWEHTNRMPCTHSHTAYMESWLNVGGLGACVVRRWPSCMCVELGVGLVGLVGCVFLLKATCYLDK